ncbi:hypothetical protein AAF712_005492 [Marasmius tenuissimus]|uniref:Restriction of telomere capping protein 4 C-terminal domain-containing protein n=1 Tax=Marasmius tenuissimus TaxID=585030 RepID=A0ABR3A2C9_9AGAR
MFPLSVLYTETFSPLAYKDFADEVLIPEIFTHLIQNDFSLPRHRAIELLHQSEFFGAQEHQLSDNDPSYQQVLRLVSTGVLFQGTNADYSVWLPLSNNKPLSQWLSDHEGITVKKEDEDAEGETDPEFVVSPSKRQGSGNTFRDPMYVDYNPKIDGNNTIVVKREDIDDSELWTPQSPTPQYRGLGSIEGPLTLCG